MRQVLPLLYFYLFFSFSIRAQETSSAADAKQPDAVTESRKDTNLSAAKVPIRRVVLYKNGVGYFEHLGHVRGSQGVHIDFTSAQLNDVLKSLTVLDLSGGAPHRSGIQLGSAAGTEVGDAAVVTGRASDHCGISWIATRSAIGSSWRERASIDGPAP
jgi:hypothetical protein